MKVKYILLITIFLTSTFFAQDSTKSQAYKSTRADNIYPLIKVKAPSYPLMTAYILQRYAAEGDPFALHEMGLRFLLGKGFPKDTIKAVQYIQRAADKNLTAAVYNYAIMMENGIGTDWNPFNAFKNAEYAAENGMHEAQFFYGIFFTDNLVVNRDYNEAYKWFSKAAEADYQPAIDAKKKMEENGLIVLADSSGKIDLAFSEVDSTSEGSSAIFNPDFELDFFDFESGDETSVEKLRKLYKQNYSELKSSLGINKITDSSQVMDTSGSSLVEFAAMKGSPEGLMILAKDYELGISRKKDLVKSVQSYIKAYRLGAMKAVEYILKHTRDEKFFDLLKKEADANNPDAMYVWAGLTALGFDYSLSSEQALDLLDRAGNLDHSYSLIEEGLCYYNGTLVEKDREKAYSYWERASKLGSAEAAIRLAFASLIQNPELNREENISFLTKTANEGAVLAQSALGYCYENGIGLKQNKSKASRFYRSAANRGSEVAYNSLKRMYDAIRPEDEQFVIFEQQ